MRRHSTGGCNPISRVAAFSWVSSNDCVNSQTPIERFRSSSGSGTSGAFSPAIHLRAAAVKCVRTPQNLEFLRATAVLCVFVAHLLRVTTAYDLGSLGRFGVILFFVPSFLRPHKLHLDGVAGSAPTHRRLAFGIRRFFPNLPA
jgi:hypothetical protein